MNILIRGGRVIDPGTRTDQIQDLYVSDGLIADVGEDLEYEADQVIQAEGCYVMPGLIDMHVHP